MMDFMCRTQPKGTASAHTFVDIGAAGDGVNTVTRVSCSGDGKAAKRTLLCVIELSCAAPMTVITIIIPSFELYVPELLEKKNL